MPEAAEVTDRTLPMVVMVPVQIALPVLRLFSITALALDVATRVAREPVPEIVAEL